MYNPYILVTLISILSQVVIGYRFGNIIDTNKIESTRDLYLISKQIQNDYTEYNSIRKNIKKFQNFSNFKCMKSKEYQYKDGCIVDENVFQQIEFVNNTVNNNTILEGKEKGKFNTFVANIKVINNIHYINSELIFNESLRNDQYFYEYHPFPTELYSFGGYFRYKFDENSIIKISNYLDVTYHHLKNIIDYLDTQKIMLSEHNPDTIKNFQINNKNFKNRRVLLWYQEIFWFLY